MGGDIKLGRLAGFPLAMNWSVLVIAWLLTWSLATGSFPYDAPGHADTTYWAAGLAAAVVFFASLLAHEVAHALVARRHGVEASHARAKSDRGRSVQAPPRVCPGS